MHFSAIEIRKMLLLGGAHYVHELKFFVRVSLLRARANRMVDRHGKKEAKSSLN